MGSHGQRCHKINSKAGLLFAAIAQQPGENYKHEPRARLQVTAHLRACGSEHSPLYFWSVNELLIIKWELNHRSCVQISNLISNHIRHFSRREVIQTVKTTCKKNSLFSHLLKIFQDELLIFKWENLNSYLLHATCSRFSLGTPLTSVVVDVLFCSFTAALSPETSVVADVHFCSFGATISIVTSKYLVLL